MADPSASPQTHPDSPSPPPPPPASSSPPPSCPVRARRAAKGKGVAVLVDTLPALKAKARGSLRGTKRPVPLPAPAGPQDVEEDVPTTSTLPQVQVEQPSSRPASPDFTPPSPIIA